VVRSLPVPFLADATLVHVVNEHGTVRLLPAVTDDVEAGTAAAVPPERSETQGPCYVTGVVKTAAVAVLTADDLAAQPFGPDVRDSAIADARAAAMFPLVIDGKVSAVLSLLSRTERRYTGAGSLVLADVAHRIRLALERIQLYREAQEANRLKDEFLSTLSHELRTPLNAIYGWARILRGRTLDESTARAVAVIQRNAEAQIRLIEEVLDVSRIITGKMALAMEIVDVADTVRAAIDIVRPAMHAKRIRFDQWIEAVPPLRGDGHRLQQVFWNVLSNALKFTGNDGAISVWLRAVPGHVEFEIADTGVGIRRDVLPFVFDRFRQADSSPTRSHGGLGLGLTIVRHIVELHGGNVRAASPGEGQGATFTIQLPVPHGIDAAAEAAGAKDRRAEASGWPKLRGRTVLIVEDHDDARDLIASVLESAGARVIAAASAGEAMERAADVRPDVLVADLGLPGEDGYTLLQRLRGRYPDVPAIALTAYARSTDRDRALAHGFERHVIKPVDPTELVDHVLAVLVSR
jgi:signal transduction histidine kinase